MSNVVQLPDNKKRVNTVTGVTILSDEGNNYEYKVGDAAVEEIMVAPDHVRVRIGDDSVTLFPMLHIERLSFKTEETIVDKTTEEIAQEKVMRKKIDEANASAENYKEPSA